VLIKRRKKKIGFTSILHDDVSFTLQDPSCMVFIKLQRTWPSLSHSWKACKQSSCDQWYLCCKTVSVV